MPLIQNFALFLAALILTACSTSTKDVAPLDQPAKAQEAHQEYRLGSGDDLRITVFGQDDLSGDYQVDGTGKISVPLVGQIQVRNLTIVELEQKIVRLLQGDYLKNPRVSAEVTNYRPFFILGEVRNPGQFPYRSGLTVIEAVAQAGGFTYRANEKIVLIKSKDAVEELSVTLDGNTLVSPGDTIRIKERFF